MADNKVENAEVAEEVCTKEKPVEKKVEEEEEEDETEEKCDGEEKVENGDSKQENGKETVEGEAEKEDSEKTACKRKSTAGDCTDGVESEPTPEKKQKLEDGEEKETTEVAA